jgi:hypothetical protein
MNSRSEIILVCFLGWLTALSGCAEQSTPPVRDGDPGGPIVHTAENGPVRMTITVSKGEITLAERFRLTVEVIAAVGVDLEMPRLDGRTGDLAIRDYREYPAELFKGRQRRRQEYRLDVFLAGRYTIPEMTTRFVDLRAGRDVLAETEVTVNEFTVTVKSAVEGELDASAFRDIKGPVSLPVDRTWAWAWWTSGGLAGVVVLVVVVVWALRRSVREAAETVIPPHEWAFDQLRRLMDERLVERGLVNEFYFRLSMIVRRYIERQYDLMAPERTTEEFILEVQAGVKLPGEYRGTVGSFLKACDMVKFAQHVPRAEEVNEALTTACDFVGGSSESEWQRVTAA